MESIYLEVEEAIKQKLHIGRKSPHSMYGMSWDYPIAIELGNIVLRDSDCGLAKPTITITTDEWAERKNKWGLWKKVGIWQFVRADDLAVACIRYANRYPTEAGRELYKLRQDIENLKRLLTTVHAAT